MRRRAPILALALAVHGCYVLLTVYYLAFSHLFLVLPIVEFPAALYFGAYAWKHNQW